MRGAVEHQMLVDLVGNDHEVVLDSEAGYGLHLASVEHLAGWVVRRVDQQQLRLRGDRRSQFVEVEAVVGRSKRDGPRHRAGEGDTRLIAVVHGLEQHDFVAGIEQAEQRPS